MLPSLGLRRDGHRAFAAAVYNFTASDLAETPAAAEARGVQIWVLVDQNKAAEGNPGLQRPGSR